MIAKCVNCGKEYQLDQDDNPANFQCDCGGNLEERKTISDYQNSEYGKNKYRNKSNTYKKDSKEDLLQRGYTIVDFDDNTYTFSKKVPVVPIWLLIIIAILLFPIGTVIAIILYFGWTEPKIKVIKTEES